MSGQQRLGKILIIVGIALLLVGFGVGIYSAVSSTPSKAIGSIPSTDSMTPSQGNVAAVTFILVGIALIALGLWKL